jgi:hypothetical protein
MAKYAQNGLRMHLLQFRISKFSAGGPLYSPTYQRGGSPPLGLYFTCTCGARPKMFGTLKGIFFGKIYYNVVSVAAGEKQGYTMQFSRQLS